MRTGESWLGTAKQAECLFRAGARQIIFRQLHAGNGWRN